MLSLKCQTMPTPIHWPWCTLSFNFTQEAACWPPHGTPVLDQLMLFQYILSCCGFPQPYIWLSLLCCSFSTRVDIGYRYNEPRVFRPILSNNGQSRGLALPKMTQGGSPDHHVCVPMYCTAFQETITNVFKNQ